jgi:hypothetical protein
MITAGWQTPPSTGLDFEMRLNAPDGKLVGSGSMPKPAAGQQGGLIPIKMTEAVNEEPEAVYFIHKPQEGETAETATVALMNVKFDSR